MNWIRCMHLPVNIERAFSITSTKLFYRLLKGLLKFFELVSDKLILPNYRGQHFCNPKPKHHKRDAQ